MSLHAVHQAVLEVPTPGRGFTDITARVQQVVAQSRVHTGLCVAFIQHTSASLCIQENADPDVRSDLGAWLEELAPEQRPWDHSAEGPDDMPAHARAAVLRTSESIPVMDGRLATGTWQGLFVVEHRARAHTRRVVVHVEGLRHG